MQYEGGRLREPEVVFKRGEILEVSKEKEQVLALGPKFCVRQDINEGDFEV